MAISAASFLQSSSALLSPAPLATFLVLILFELAETFFFLFKLAETFIFLVKLGVLIVGDEDTCMLDTVQELSYRPPNALRRRSRTRRVRLP
jgi:hypothetical protein